MTAVCDCVKVIAPQAQFAGSSMCHKVVVRTQHLEVVQVIDDGDALPLQFPKNRRREVMVDSANVGEIGCKVLHASPHAAAGGGGKSGVGGPPTLSSQNL